MEIGKLGKFGRSDYFDLSGKNSEAVRLMSAEPLITGARVCSVQVTKQKLETVQARQSRSCPDYTEELAGWRIPNDREWLFLSWIISILDIL